MKSCRNCEKPLLYDADFCHACGQKYTDGKYPVWKVFTEFIDGIFSFEARSLKTVAGLFLPGFLTKEYFSGAQTKYMPPSRIFILTTGVFLAIFGYQINKALSSKADEISDSIHGFLVKQSVMQEIDSVYTDFKAVGALGLDTFKTDSLITKINEAVSDSISISGPLNGAIGISDSTGQKINIPFSELADGNVDRIIEKYNIESDWWGRTILTQMVRFTKSPNAFIQQVLGSLIWMILLLMPTVALILKLLYVRRKKLFIEHLLFSFHFHAFAFLSLAIVLGFFPGSLAILGAVLGVILIYLFIAIKQFYGQSILKSFLKWWLLLVGYTFIFLFYFAIWLLMSLITF